MSIILFLSRRCVSDLQSKSHPLRTIVATEEVAILAFFSSPLVAISITKGSIIGQYYDETVIYEVYDIPYKTRFSMSYQLLLACLPPWSPVKHT